MKMSVPPSSPGNTELLLQLVSYDDDQDKIWNRKALVEEAFR